MMDGSSPGGRERSSSLQGMDMASLPPRKRPWQDGPGTDPMEAPDGGNARFNRVWTWFNWVWLKVTVISIKFYFPFLQDVLPEKTLVPLQDEDEAGVRDPDPEEGPQ